MRVNVILRWSVGATVACFIAAAAVLVPSLVTPGLAPRGDELVVPPVVAQAEVRARVGFEARLRPEHRAPSAAAADLRTQVARPTGAVQPRRAATPEAPDRPRPARPRPAPPTQARPLRRPSPQTASAGQERREEENADDHDGEPQPRVLLAQKAKPAHAMPPQASDPHAKRVRRGIVVEDEEAGDAEHEAGRPDKKEKQEDDGRDKDKHEDGEKD